ncbi:MAG TPA: App1 family protein [Anaeromyxobacteraceae bacterium]|nr:App1 family protein [Anaeromyxobacteraceae bacterium]
MPPPSAAAALATALLAGLALGVQPARAEERALLLPASMGRTDRVWIFGRVLEEAHDGGPTAWKNLRRLAGSNVEGAPVEVTFLGRAAKAVSGHDGEFEVEIPAGPGDPFPPGVQRAEVRSGPARAGALVHVVAPGAPFIVVSDFDDTVAVTNVRSLLELLDATFLQDERTQPAVAAMAAFYGCLAAASPAPAFAFVSGSPVQLAPRIAAFLERNGFPPAALFLRNLGPGTLSRYKEPVLERLAARFPQPFVLVGDSGERDPEIYAAFARAHPGRVRAVYVRHAPGDPGPPARFEGERLFEDPSDALRDAIGRGLAPGCSDERTGVPSASRAPDDAPDAASR